MNPFEQIWNGWRSEYVQSAGVPTGEGEQGSVFTRILNSGLSDEQTFIVHRGSTCFAMLNVYPYGTGHLLVLPYREVGELGDLDTTESVELWATVTDAVAAVKRAYDPPGVNIGVNMGRAAGGSVSEHLHVHVLPRWVGDSNFMTAIANARTLPEPLDDTARKIRAGWPAEQ